MKQFLKKGEVQLVNGGYLSNKEEKPVFNQQFVDLQKRAEYIITFSKLAKGKDFKGTEAYSLAQLKADVSKELATKATKFVEAPKAPVKKLTEQLAEEALSFISFKEDTSKADKINAFLQDFNTLKEFEDFGLFFEDGIVKLSNIYTMDEVVAAVKETIEIL